jgi:hypothetical protein
MSVVRDEFAQPIEMSDFDLDILAILEEVATESINPDKSLSAYVADIKDRFIQEADK